MAHGILPHWTLSHLIPLHPELLMRHPLMITQHLILGVLVQKKSRLMCAKHSVIVTARFAHRCQRLRHYLVMIGGSHYMSRFRVRRHNNMSLRRTILGAHHLTTESYVTNCVEIMVYYCSPNRSHCGLGHNGCGMGCP